MSLFSTGDNPPPEPAHAWGMAAANLLLWPGLGTALARKKSGLVQMGLSGGGLLLTVVGMAGFYFRWMTTTEFPGWRDRYVLCFAAGMVCFAIAWLWALGSSIQIIRAARTQALTSAADNRPPPQLSAGH
jgi:hypothetical protein